MIQDKRFQECGGLFKSSLIEDIIAKRSEWSVRR
jgi:hypothetical protein